MRWATLLLPSRLAETKFGWLELQSALCTARIKHCTCNCNNNLPNAILQVASPALPMCFLMCLCAKPLRLTSSKTGMLAPVFHCVFGRSKKKQILKHFRNDRFRVNLFGSSDPQVPAVGWLLEVRVTATRGCRHESNSPGGDFLDTSSRFLFRGKVSNTMFH